jgi:hypothetical protein
MKFNSEEELVLHFKNYFYKRINKDFIYLEEVKGLFGIPDGVLIKRNENNICIISIEFKLNNWKRAIQQAFKYKSFSTHSFVIFDGYCSKNILKNIEDFKQFNIGLGFFNKNQEFNIVYCPKFERPFSEHYVNKMLNILEKNIESNNVITRDKVSIANSEDIFFQRYIQNDYTV